MFSDSDTEADDYEFMNGEVDDREDSGDYVLEDDEEDDEKKEILTMCVDCKTKLAKENIYPNLQRKWCEDDQGMQWRCQKCWTEYRKVLLKRVGCSEKQIKKKTEEYTSSKKKIAARSVSLPHTPHIDAISPSLSRPQLP